MIDQLFEHGGIEFLLAQKIDQNSRINIAAPRAHDHRAVGVDAMVVSINYTTL